MRTTLELDDDLIATAKDLAREQGVTLGRVISELARQSLAAKAPPKVRNGVQLIVPKPGARKPDLQLVNELRDGD
jgi:hypothetical protein